MILSGFFKKYYWHSWSQLLQNMQNLNQFTCWFKRITLSDLSGDSRITRISPWDKFVCPIPWQIATVISHGTPMKLVILNKLCHVPASCLQTLQSHS